LAILAKMTKMAKMAKMAKSGVFGQKWPKSRCTICHSLERASKKQARKPYQSPLPVHLGL
jgi:cytochrome c2